MHIHEVKLFLCKFQGCERAHENHGFLDQWNLDFHMERVHGNSSSQPSNNSNSPSPSDGSLQYSHKSPANSRKDRRTSSPTKNIVSRTIKETTSRNNEQDFRIHHGASRFDTKAAYKQPAPQKSRQHTSETALHREDQARVESGLMKRAPHFSKKVMFEPRFLSPVGSRDGDSARDSVGQKTGEHLAESAIELLGEDETLSALTDYPDPQQMFETSNVGDDDSENLHFLHERFDREHDVHIKASIPQPRHRSMATPVGAKNMEIELEDETDKDETNRDETDKDETDKDETDKDETDKDETDKDETDKDETDKDETDKDETDKDETDKDETDKDETDKDETDKDETDKDETDKDETDKEGFDKDIIDFVFDRPRQEQPPSFNPRSSEPSSFEPALSDGMSYIRKKVLGGLRQSETVRASLAMNWDLLGFIKDQYSDTKTVDLGSIITLSGTVLRAQATTCLEYAQKTWPSQARMVISAFQSAIDSREHKFQGSSSPSCHHKDSIVCVLTFTSLDTQSRYRN